MWSLDYREEHSWSSSGVLGLPSQIYFSQNRWKVHFLDSPSAGEEIFTYLSFQIYLSLFMAPFKEALGPEKCTYEFLTPCAMKYEKLALSVKRQARILVTIIWRILLPLVGLLKTPHIIQWLCEAYWESLAGLLYFSLFYSGFLILNLLRRIPCSRSFETPGALFLRALKLFRGSICFLQSPVCS